MCLPITSFSPRGSRLTIQCLTAELDNNTATIFFVISISASFRAMKTPLPDAGLSPLLVASLEVRMLDPLSADAVITADKVCPNKPVLKFDRTCNLTASRGWHGYQYYGNLDLKSDIRSELRALSAFRNSIGRPPLASATIPGHPQNHYCARGLEFAPRNQASRTGQQEAQLARTETNDTHGEDPPTNASEQSKRPVVVSVVARFSPNGLATPSFSSPVYPVQQADHGCKGLMVLAAADRKLTQAFLNNPDRCLAQQEAGILNRQQMRVEILSRPESHQAALARLGQSRNLCVHKVITQTWGPGQGHGCKGGGLAWAPLL
ncbi:hypothetical protein M431DRAFT_528425 [Trichoderma harzianum CBS 226.95]|uniref:Uncharacterized protein n=1 Tax=Trichoderma harzianum CBS 226.95 TaxID=983964 RepID=A0A2T4AK85_TRIHA|nr:hypothetical protein M431DRAFT_528425 [Trichoderma harzianum CBS 226.95]PTB57494.1 hypothetical protein M431DRAFT_528425 [Trichoderma harzianum CBS 226.95]